MLKYLILFSLCFSLLAKLPAQLSPVPYTQAGFPVEQSFNGLPASGSFTLNGKGPFYLSQPPVAALGMQGWYILQITGSQPNTNFSPSTGSATGSGIYSYGTSGNQNRALGSLAAGTGVYGFGMVLKNETGIILNRIQIRFLATQWRKGGSGNKNTWRFGYQYGDSINSVTDTLIKNNRLDISSIHFSSGAATLNGHLPLNQVWLEDSITGIYWRPGQYLLLQWSDTDETGSDDAMAIDDFSFTAFQQSGKPIISKEYTDSIGTYDAFLSAVINDQLLHTTVELQIDSTENFLTASSSQQIVPSTIIAGAGDVMVHAKMDRLLPVKKYYYRFTASNQLGVSYGNIHQLITKAALAIVQTDSILKTGINSCNIYGSVKSDGGDAVLETGLCWGTDSLPTIHGQHILIAGNRTNFEAQINALPPGTRLFFRTYCKNSAGIAYGNTLSWFTPTSILSFNRNGATVSGKDTIVYDLQFKEKVKGITATHFQLWKEPDSDASIIQVIENKLSWLVVINTGNRNGDITPVFLASHSYEPDVVNAPYTANTTTIDKTGPAIRSVHFANRPYKAGDSIHVLINTDPEKGLLKMISGNIMGYALQQFTKINDSSWIGFCVVKNGGREINAAEDIEIVIVLSDEAGNRNTNSSFRIMQNNDAIDLTRPLTDRLILPGKSLLKSGDSLFIQLQCNEVIILDSSNGSPVLSVTIGTRVRTAFLYRITNSMLTFCYIIQPEEIDMDGIRIASSITLNNAIITDIAGNTLNNNIPNAGVFSNIKIDALAPFITNVITPIARTYGIGDTLFFHLSVSESLVIPATAPFPFLEITVGNTVYRTTFLHSKNNLLLFYWIVEKETTDKNGISIRNILLNSELFSDSSGNNIEPVLKNISSLSNVLVDGIAPVFKDSIVFTEVCSGGILKLSDAIQFDCAEQNEMLSWIIFSSPIQGSIQGLPFNSRWISGSSLPDAVFYTPAASASGFDRCIVQVSDGVNTSFQKINIKINSGITGNNISADQIICAGFSAQALQGNQIKGGNGTYRFIWESGNGNSYQKAAGIFDQETYLPLNLHTTTKFRRIVSSGKCADTSAGIIIEVRNKGLWLGKQSNNWNTGANWCGGLVPDRHTDVHFNRTDNKNNIQIDDSAFCKSMFADSSNLIQLNGSLLFTGMLTGRGNINAENGTIISAGIEKQLLHTDIFKNKYVNHLVVSGLELELSDTLYIGNGFSIQKGSFNSNNKLILKHRATNHPNAQSTSLKGRITMGKLINGRQKELLMHHPFKNDVLLQPTTDSIYTINTPQKADKNNASIVWETIATNNHLPWPSQKGIALTKPGLISQKNDSMPILLSGYLFTGDVLFEFASNFDSSYILTGNPYLSAINSKYITKSEGIGNHYWVWDTSFASNGAYRVKTFSANNTIQSFDGFIIKATSGNPLSLLYTEQAKLTTPIPDSLEGCIENTHQLEIELVKDTKVHDKLLILDVDAARTRYDPADAEKMFNPESNLYSLSADSIPLSVDARWMTSRTYIPIGIDTKNKGQFILKFSRVWLKPGITLELHDQYSGNKIKIDTGSLYQFSITQHVESYGRNRFIIRSPLPPELPDEMLQLQLYPVPAANFLIVSLQAKQKGLTTILIKNLQGQVLVSRTMGEQTFFTEQIPISGLLKGHYIVEVHSGKYVIAKNFIKL